MDQLRDTIGNTYRALAKYDPAERHLRTALQLRTEHLGEEHIDVAASLLSLGALDFGLVVDGSVVMVENMVRSLAEEQKRLGRTLDSVERRTILSRAPHEVARPVAFGVGIILIVFVPILTLEGIEGKEGVNRGESPEIHRWSGVSSSLTRVPSATGAKLVDAEVRMFHTIKPAKVRDLLLSRKGQD